MKVAFLIASILNVCMASYPSALLGALRSDDECWPSGLSLSHCALSALQRSRSTAEQREQPEQRDGSHEGFLAKPNSSATSMLAVTWSSCLEIGCYSGYYNPWLCSCSAMCHFYYNCCPDFYARCTSPPGSSLSSDSVVIAEGSLAVPRIPVGLYAPKVPSLSKPSDAPAHTFYMYRVEGDSNYAAENVNMGNLPGILWYLHNEVVERTPRKFGATRVLRYKVTTKATAPLFEKGMNFGLRFAFDSGMCTGPYNCQEQFNKYGYFVGCNYVDQWPTDLWKGQNHYPGAIWYSLPGPCSARRYAERPSTCWNTDPGGHCASATGEGTCTYSYEAAGEISIDELVGIPDFRAFIAKGGKEYSRHTDRGHLTSFWDNKMDDAACSRRLQVAQKLFAAKGAEDLPTPPCDFKTDSFFR